MNRTDPATLSPPPRWAVIVAFALVYLCWGTTYLAIRVGVQSFPPFLFGGTRIGSAGLLVFLFLVVTRQPLRLSMSELLWTCLSSLFLFVIGNGLITAAEKYIESADAAVLVATTPIWAALVEMAWPRGDRLTMRGWFGLIVGLGGVCILLSDKLQQPADIFRNVGPPMAIASAACWAIGASLLRHRRHKSAQLSGTAYQMLIGGLGLTLCGLMLGETQQLDWDTVTAGAVYSFFHLLVFGSLLGYVAYVWLLKHVSVTTAGTYAYVNPVVAIIVAWLIGNEQVTAATIGGMAIVLVGVALVRTGERASARPPSSEPSAQPDTAVHFPSTGKRLECQRQDH